MLVLSRRPGQKVVFPSLGVTIEVLRSRGSLLRLGIEAPSDIPVFRDEVLPPQDVLGGRADSPAAARSVAAASATRQVRHAWRNKLNHLLLKLQLLQRQQQLSQLNSPDQALNEIIAELADLEATTLDSVAQSPSTGGAARRILIVEDQANERELLATCMRLGGIEVATASNGHEAFDWLHEHTLPDLVLLDMRMPEVDGPTFLRQIRADARLTTLRVFAVSGSSRSEFEPDTLPVDGWFSKPVRVDSLLQAVRSQPAPIRATV